VADIRGEWIRSLSWRSSEELRYRLVTMDFFLTFCFMEQGGLLLPCFFYGYKNGWQAFRLSAVFILRSVFKVKTVMARFLLDSVECFAEIVDDIVDMLGTDGQTDGVLLNALICQLLVSQLCVCC
jgi:hypothetical protein